VAPGGFLRVAAARRLLPLLAALAGFLVWGCENVSVVVVELDRISVSPQQRTLIEGESFDAVATLFGADGEVLTGRDIVWSTSSSSVVSLSQSVGSQVRVNALGAGSATVRAASGGRSAQAQVEVLRGPSLVLTPAEISIDGTEGEASPAANVGISNGGNGSISGLAAVVSFGAGTSVEWLSVGLNGTTVPTSLTLVASGVGLTAGTYTATVRLSAPTAGGLTAAVEVTFNVSPPPPVIVLSSDAVGLGATFGSSQGTSANVGITNGGAGELTELSASVTYPPGKPQGWLTATLLSTTAPATLRVTAVAGLLQAGTYTAQVSVFSPVARFSPVLLDVTFRVALPRETPRP
jgi:hypothetical protein